MFDYPLPTGLTHLLEAGVWPTHDGNSVFSPNMNIQESNRIIPVDRVRAFAEDASVICLHPAPFHTIAQEQAGGGSGDFWERYGALEQINPERALVLGDFGMGSDAPVILDFSKHAVNPPVLYLRWGIPHEDVEWPQGDKDFEDNEWVQGATDFDEFALMLGLNEFIA